MRIVNTTVIFLFVVTTFASSTSWHVCYGQNRERAYTSPFRYVIVHNEVIVDEDEPSYTNRRVEVLLDEKAFSEKTLKQLLEFLVKRFPTPDSLTITVYTNLEQIDTPEERETGRIFVESPTGRGKPTEEELMSRKYPSAVLMRQDGNELFRYTIKPNNLRLKTVILKGRDPAP
jgi:hypothetical protein